MFPKLVDLGQISLWGYSFHPILHTYGFLLAVGFLLGLKFAASKAKKLGVETRMMMDLGLYILVSALVGAKLLLLIVDWDHFQHDPMSLLRSGGIFYGGLVAAIITALWYFRKHRLAPWQMADIIAPAIALGHGVGRLGCFSAGCCYGKPTNSFLGVVFKDDYAHQIVGVPLGASLHPTQLYEAAAEFLIFLVLILLSRKKRFDGQIFWTYVALYAIARFVIEFFRGDPRGYVFGGAISTSQFIGIIMFGTAMIALAVLRRGPKPKLA
jgi:phosphatidylglycerol:prolipoprotein diacylglycerol transferase